MQNNLTVVKHHHGRKYPQADIGQVAAFIPREGKPKGQPKKTRAARKAAGLRVRKGGKQQRLSILADEGPTG